MPFKSGVLLVWSALRFFFGAADQIEAALQAATIRIGPSDYSLPSPGFTRPFSSALVHSPSPLLIGAAIAWPLSFDSRCSPQVLFLILTLSHSFSISIVSPPLSCFFLFIILCGHKANVKFAGAWRHIH
jgi:hypothetical protein